MSEYLIVSSGKVTYRIESSEIMYIMTSKKIKNNSVFSLVNGTDILVRMSLTDVRGKIKEYFKQSRDNFRDIGSSLIINMVHLYTLSQDENGRNRLGFVNRQADGFLTGYFTGYWDGKHDGKPKFDIVYKERFVDDLYEAPFVQFKSELEGKEKKKRNIKPSSLKNLKKKVTKKKSNDEE